MSVLRWIATGAVAIAAASGIACERKQPEINGIGPWALMKTTLAEAPGFCSPADITFCSGNGAVPLGDHAAEANLYFRGAEPDSPLAEIELSVRACDHEKLRRALVEVLGPPTQQVATRVWWRGTSAFVAAALPSAPRRCSVSFVAANDAARIKELSAPPAPGSAESP
jgi:hypothetical protein